MKFRIFPISENALTIDFGNEISSSLNSRVLSLTDFFSKNPFRGFIETVPAYSSLTIFYNLVEVRASYRSFSSAHSAIGYFIESALNNLEALDFKSRNIEIPVCYGKEFAPDLDFIAHNAGLSPGEIVRLHTSKSYRVFMIGFLPAFAYMGEVDELIATPRRETPRTSIAKGSVGIAGKQTGIYPLASPGGWQIIGLTPLDMFQPQEADISYLQPGDSVKFYPISKNEFYQLKRK